MLNNPGLSVLLNITMEVGLEPIDLIKYIVDQKGPTLPQENVK